MRHVTMLLFLILYVLVIGQNWAHYAVAFMIYAYERHDGHLRTRL